MLKNRIAALLSVILCLYLCIGTASAAETGSICVKGIRGTVSLHHVADADFRLTEDFQGAAVVTLEDYSVAAENARILSDFVAENELAGWELSAEATGEVLFEPLEEGMYLVCSLSPQMEFMPFLVRIPMKIYGNTVYHVLAEPKKDPTPDTPTPPSPPVEPEPEIPQTGTSVLPKYLLLALGSCFIVFGVSDLFRGRRRSDP